MSELETGFRIGDVVAMVRRRLPIVLGAAVGVPWLLSHRGFGVDAVRFPWGGWRWSRPAIAAWFRAMGSVPASSADNDNSLTFEGRPDARPGSFSAATDALVAAQRGVLEDRFVHGRGIQEARSGGAATGTE